MISLYSFIIIFLMLILNAVLAAYEIAIASIPRAKLKVLAEKKRAGAIEALFMKDQIEGSFAVIQLGITLVGVIAAAIGGAGMGQVVAPYLIQQFNMAGWLAQFIALVVFIIPLSVLTIIFGELVPKTFALKNQTWVCLKLSAIMKTIYIILHPVIMLFELIVKMITEKSSQRISPESQLEHQSVLELKALASMARVSRLIGMREEKIVHAAVELSVRDIKDIIIPIEDVSMILKSSTLIQALLRAHMDMHTRFPVVEYEGDPSSVVGYVNLKDIIYTLHGSSKDKGILAILRPIKTFSFHEKISIVMEKMIQQALHIAMIKDDDEKIIGMVTLEDILEELVGKIPDEYDRLPSYIHVCGSGWVMGGGVLLDQVSKKLGVSIKDIEETQNNMTLAQWCKKYCVCMKGAESFCVEGLTIVPRKFRRKELLEAFVMLKEE